ncbi:hypothetical protein RJ639_001069 [Escallonia herrerae]|uniref:ABC transporter domain-containing protein n=1 Tax=Escallonia herrerae TaxID=1293975 RepID=A0AA89BSZ5_9ASTE|nr:hypothetical protein RJ639_001069 [Escallonia herrerae]
MASKYSEPAHMEEEKTNDEIEDTKKEIAAETLPFLKLLSYADALDWTLMILATLGSIVHGFAQPVSYLLLGKALDAFGRNINDPDAMVTALNNSLTYATPDLQIFNQAKAAGKEVFQVIERKPLVSYETRGKVLEAVEGSIELREVHFAYPSRQEKLILKGFSLSIPAGKVVALVGSSGCGKSTVISLVSRFYDPAKGKIFIDNHDIKDLDLKFLRRNIRTVSQEPSLFAGTISDNMKVRNKDADDQQIQSAAVIANALSFISQLPNQIANPAEETASSRQSKDLEQPEDPKKLSRHLTEDPPKQEERTDRRKKHTSFRIWFGLKKKELVKTVMGSIAAALSGISKPIFRFFVITIGVAYYKKDAKQRVGWYSIAFS